MGLVFSDITSFVSPKFVKNKVLPRTMLIVFSDIHPFARQWQTMRYSSKNNTYFVRQKLRAQSDSRRSLKNRNDIYSLAPSFESSI